MKLVGLALLALFCAACPASSEAYWQNEAVDGSGDARFISFDLDGSGSPHLAYCSQRTDKSGATDLKYAYKGHSGWRVRTIDGSGLVIGFTAMGMDLSGQPHVMYLVKNSSETRLMYAHEERRYWRSEPVDACKNIGQLSLAVDAGCMPHFSYSSLDTGDLMYCYKSVSGWNAETADGDGNAGQFSSLDLDDSGAPHIAYFKKIEGSGLPVFALYYARKYGDAWRAENLTCGELGPYLSLNLDSSSSPHISYVDSKNRVVHAHKDFNGWHLDAVANETQGCFIGRIFMATDSLGNPHITYPVVYPATNAGAYLASSGEPGISASIKHAYRDDLGWKVDVISNMQSIEELEWGAPIGLRSPSEVTVACSADGGTGTLLAQLKHTSDLDIGSAHAPLNYERVEIGDRAAAGYGDGLAKNHVEMSGDLSL